MQVVDIKHISAAPTGREGRTILLKSCLVRNLGHNTTVKAVDCEAFSSVRD